MKLIKRNQFTFLCFGFIAGVLAMYLYQNIIYNNALSNIYHGMMFSLTGMVPSKKLPTHSRIENFAIINDLDKFYLGNNFAKKMAQDVSILCWILTQANNLQTKGITIINTWGKRCNILLFISSTEDSNFPAIAVDAPEGRENLWKKTKAAWLYIKKNYHAKAKWFLKADDDTFVIPENLRYFLTQFKSKKDYYFGRHFHNYKGYNSGGAGYVFSQATLNSFASIANDPNQCPSDSEMEDVQVGVCLDSLGIHPSETRDDSVEEIFHPLSPVHHLIPGIIKETNWLHEYNRWEVKSGSDCCSKYSVSFHYVDHNDMYLLDYFIYKFRVFGSSHFSSDGN